MKRKNQYYRTDIAYEDLVDTNETEEYSYHITQRGSIVINHVKILKEKILERQIGDYIGIEFPELENREIQEEIIEVCVEKLKELLENLQIPLKRVLVVGLGNQEVIADALGNQTAKQLYVTAHMKDHNYKQVAVITPGVKGQTGMETVELVKSVVAVFQPDIIIAIDALATRHIERVNRVIQITNTGIQPGSGIGNQNRCLNEQSMNVPVIAIGVSSVIDIISILQQMIEKLDLQDTESLYEQLSQKELSLMVTPKEMDYELLYLSHLLARIINQSLHTDE